jgi:hypothetical protein
MKKKLLFENVGGNQFRINKELSETNPKAGLIREGLKKIFSMAEGKDLSYTYISNIGMGYIKDVSEARKCALQEAKEIASDYGYVEDDHRAKFVKG